MTTNLTKPLWVEDNPLIKSILSSLLDKIDKNQQRISIKISEKTTPELFQYNDYDCDQLWSLIEYLESEYQIITIEKKNQRYDIEVYRNATLLLNRAKETLVRDWLQRPKLEDYSSIWQTAFDEYKDRFGSTGIHLLQSKIVHPHKDAHEIMTCFANLAEFLKKPHGRYTLRTLSAKFFWGDSKFLDNKHDLIYALFPNHVDKLKERPLLIHVYIPASLKQILFIENQDTFLNVLKQREQIPNLESTALVYCAGFKGTATRIRNSDNVMFSFMNKNVAHNSLSVFEKWWFNNKPELNAYFWGDLDYSGMTILSSLKKVFTNMQAWKPGYDALLQLTNSGNGHDPIETGKKEQKDPGKTGCHYSDLELLPHMRENNKFIDQEAVLIETLKL